MATPTIKASKLAFVRVSAPGLDAAERFLTEFGLQVAERTDGSLYLRGSDAEAPCYILSAGSSAVTAIGFEVDDAQALDAFAAMPGASAVSAMDGPGGGRVVRMMDPVGMQVEIVHGRSPLDPLPPAPAHAYNMNGQKLRAGALPAVPRGPSTVRRLGHLVLESADPESLYRWYNQHLGLLVSDAVRLPDGSPQMIFSRLDRGDAFVDHHVIGFQFALDEGVRVQHMAFEVGNLDDLMGGHEHLKRRRYKHVWGIGRHLLGGQIFDYWKSPYGVIHEHWTDTDLVNAAHEAKDCPVAKMQDYWGPAPKPAFLIARWNLKTVRNVLRLLKARMQGASAR